MMLLALGLTVLLIVGVGSTNALSWSEIDVSSVRADRDPSGNISFESDHLRVLVDGVNPHISFFFKENGSMFATFYKFIFSSLNETDENGTLVQYYQLEQAQWSVSDPLSGTIDGNNYVNVNMSATLSIFGIGGITEVPITIQMYMYETTQVLPYGNETIEVPGGSFKYTVEIGAWPFLDVTNSLELSLKFISNVAVKMSHDLEAGTINATSEDGLDLTMTNPDLAIVDGQVAAITTSIFSSGAMQFITYEFPNYNESLIYDPVVDLSLDTSLDQSGNDLSMESDHLRAIFDGTTPHVKFFYKANASNFTTFYKIMFSSLNETDANGGLVKYQRLETALWTHSGPIEITDENNATLINVNFTTILSVFSGTPPVQYDVPVTIRAYLALDEIAFDYANTTIIAAAGSFKFSVEIGAWPFESPENQLELNVQLISNVNAVMNFDQATGKMNATSEEGVRMTIDNPDLAIADGNVTSITSTYRTVGNMQFLSYLFGSFNESLEYDPIVDLSASSTDGSTSTDDTTTSDDTAVLPGEEGGSVGDEELSSEDAQLSGGTVVISTLALLVLPAILYRRKKLA